MDIRPVHADSRQFTLACEIWQDVTCLVRYGKRADYPFERSKEMPWPGAWSAPSGIPRALVTALDSDDESSVPSATDDMVRSGPIGIAGCDGRPARSGILLSSVQSQLELPACELVQSLGLSGALSADGRSLTIAGYASLMDEASAKETCAHSPASLHAYQPSLLVCRGFMRRISRFCRLIRPVCAFGVV